MNQDFFGLPATTNAHATFFSGVGRGSPPFVAWQKPRGKTMAFILAVGGGGGGGGGMTGATGTARGGGGGGGSGAAARLIMPLAFLPDTIYVQAGGAGAGGAATIAGGAGNRSYVSIAPNTTAANLILISGAANAGGGAAGNAASTAAGGTAETISTTTLSVIGNFGVSTFTAGRAGGNGGTMTGGLTTVASATGGAGLNVPHGTAPTSPVNGDIWTTPTDALVRLGGVTYPLGFRKLILNTQSSTYTLALVDEYSLVYSQNSGAQVINIPTNATTAIGIGAVIPIINDGTASISLTPAGGVTLKLAGSASTGTRTIAANAAATLVKVGTDRWFVSGAGVS